MQKIVDILTGNRDKPTILHSSRYTLVAIKKFIEESISQIRQESTSGTLEILDFGCGEQPYRYIFEKDLYTGCDIGASPERNDKMQIIGEGELLPYENESFDCILCTEVLEHLKYPELYGKELYRVLKKGGTLVLTVPQIWSYHPYPQHFFLYTPDGIGLVLGDMWEKKEMFGDTSPFQTGMMISLMYSDWGVFHYLKVVYIFLVNVLILPFPGYHKYNNATSHIYLRYKK